MPRMGYDDPPAAPNRVTMNTKGGIPMNRNQTVAKKVVSCLLVMALACALLLGQSVDSFGKQEQVSYEAQQFYSGVSYGTEEAAAAELRQKMVAREGTITVYVSVARNKLTGLAERLFDAAIAHTGQPTEGDYLRWHIGSYEGTISYLPGETIVNAEITYNISYYTTAEQELELTNQIQSLLDEWDLYDATDYEKICAIYDYICNHISYDFDHLDLGASYLRMFTAYAAMMDGTAVCQGYASLLYRLALTLGVDARLIGGDSGGPHAWNIVRIGSMYYNVDSTWDAILVQEGMSYQYFLLNETNFVDHLRKLEYDNSAFHAQYPMSGSDYAAAPLAGQNQCGENAYWSWDGSGVLTISGEGALYQYTSAEQLPWAMYADRMHTLVIEEGITAIDSVILAGCENLSTVKLPASLTNVADSAFADAIGLWHVLYAGTENQWNAVVIGSGNDNLQNAMRHYSYTGEETVDAVEKICEICIASCTHQWDEGEITKAPGCTTSGKALYRCELCNVTESRTLKSLGHDWAAATCTNPQICQRCNGTKGKATGHDWTPASCTAPKTCNTCSETEGEALEHTWSEATCTTPKTCIDCGATQGEPLPHPWLDASCTTPKTCPDCDATEGEPMDHPYGQWEIVTEPTEEAPGEKLRVCTACGDEEREEIPALIPAPTEPIPSQTEPTSPTTPTAPSTAPSAETTAPTQTTATSSLPATDTTEGPSVVMIVAIAVLGAAVVVGVILVVGKKK